MSELCFEDVTVGLEIPSIVRGPISTAHVFRWSAATENWHRIHYDHRFAVEQDGLPDVMVNGSWKQNLLIQVVNDWLDGRGWLWKVEFQFRAMNIPGEILTAWGTVTGKSPCGEYGAIELDVGLLNDMGVESTPGKAVAIIPHKDGPAVPSSFSPKFCEGLSAGALEDWAARLGLKM